MNRPANFEKRASPRDDEQLDEGVITLADKTFFPGFVLLYTSIQRSYPVPVTCYDGGLTEGQIQWASRHLRNCVIKPIPDTDEIKLVKEKLDGMSENGTSEYLLWVCPFLIASSPYRRTLWLDSDLVVLKNLGALFEQIDDGPVFTRENHAPSKTPNEPTLYTEMPLEHHTCTATPLVNGGVSGWDIVRDEAIINDYANLVLLACRKSKLRQSISWHDQGCLIWAIQNNGLTERVMNDINWNLCAMHHVQDVDYNLNKDLNEQLGTAYPDANMVHWNGFPLMEKLFNCLGNENDLLNTILKQIPGARHVAGTCNKKPRLKLVSYICSTVNPCMLEHFIEHYQSQEIDDFLIILHKANDQYQDAVNILAGYGIKPVMYVSDYSAMLKAKRVMEIKNQHISQHDWVVYADVDELQVYPSRLKDILKQCDSHGYTALTGVFIDRIAENGELIDIETAPSIWEQFPYSAPVTQEITGGWHRKVCVAKGGVSLCYSGSHHRNYGCDNVRAYKATYLDPTNWPGEVEIHHFKWDASLRTRLENKLSGKAGDRDSLDGQSFIHEYHALQRHIKENNRIAVEEYVLQQPHNFDTCA